MNDLPGVFGVAEEEGEVAVWSLERRSRIIRSDLIVPGKDRTDCVESRSRVEGGKRTLMPGSRRWLVRAVHIEWQDDGTVTGLASG